MARQSQPEDGSTTRQASAPIDINYGNGEQAHRNYYWQEDRINRWQEHRHRFEDNEADDDYDDHLDQSVTDEEDGDQMMANGFSSGVIEPPIDVEEAERRNQSDVDEHQQRADEAIKQQKIAEMNNDLFEQLLAENERELRRLISLVSNVHLILK